MKKTKKIIIILFISITILLLFSTIVRAEIGINTEDYKTRVTTTENEEGLKVIGTILGIVRNLGVIASVLVISIIGFKYMLGSLEEKANYKENIILYIVGCFLLVSATTLPNAIYNLATDGNGETTFEGKVSVTFQAGTWSTTVDGYPGDELKKITGSEVTKHLGLPTEEFSRWVEMTATEGGKIKNESIGDKPKFPDKDITYTAIFRRYGYKDGDEYVDGYEYFLAPDNGAVIKLVK